MKLKVQHNAITSSLTFYEVEEALFSEPKRSAKGVPYATKFFVPAARAVIPQMLATVELFRITVVDLTSTIIKAQFVNLELQMQGIRAADALHVTTALISDADILITGDEHILSLDSFILG